MRTALFMVCWIATQVVFADHRLHEHNLTSASNTVPVYSYGTGNQHTSLSVPIGSRPHYRHEHKPNSSSAEYHVGRGKYDAVAYSKSRNTAYQNHGHLPQRGDSAKGNNYSNIHRSAKTNSLNRNIDDPANQRENMFYSQEQNYPKDSYSSDVLDEHVTREHNHMQNQINLAYPSNIIQSNVILTPETQEASSLRKQEHTQSNDDVLFQFEPKPSINVASGIVYVNSDEEQKYVYLDRALQEDNMHLLDLHEQDEEVHESQNNSFSPIDPSIMQFNKEQSLYSPNGKSEDSGVVIEAQDTLGSIESNSETFIDGDILPSPHHPPSVDFADDYQHPQYPSHERNHNQHLKEMKLGIEKKREQWEYEGESNTKREEGIVLNPHKHSRKVPYNERTDSYYRPKYLSANKKSSSIGNGDDNFKKGLDDDIKWKSSAKYESMDLKKSYGENKLDDTVDQGVLFKPMITGEDNGKAIVNRNPREGSGGSQIALLKYSAHPYKYTDAREILQPSRHQYPELYHPNWQDVSHLKYLSTGNTHLQGDEATCKCCGTKVFYDTYPDFRHKEHGFHKLSHNIQNIHLPGNVKYSDAPKTQISEPNPRCPRITVAQKSHRNLYQWNAADDFLLQTRK